MIDTLLVLNRYGLLENSRLFENKMMVSCPFHQEYDPSMSVNLDTGYFYCFGCEEKGSIIKFVSLIEEIDELEALRLIATFKLGDLKKKKKIIIEQKGDQKKLIREAYEFFSSLPRPDWDHLTGHYMIQRGYRPATLTNFDVRINPAGTHPIIIPIFCQEKFAGYISRRINNDEPRYLYSKGFPRRSCVVGNLKIGTPALLVEGIMDFMMAWQFGFKNVCCSNGWKVTDFQRKRIEKLTSRLICGLDNDEAGERGYKQLIDSFSGRVKRLSFPKGIKDIGEMTRAQFLTSLRRCKVGTN